MDILREEVCHFWTKPSAHIDRAGEDAEATQ
jgi:hypothetical protein